MSGGLMQLVAHGAQDIYLTGNPVITFFKAIYRRHTNFAMESIMQMFNSPVNFGTSVTALIDRAGDLLTGIYLQTTLPDLTATSTDSGGTIYSRQRWIDNIGHYLIKEVGISIGGQEIDRHYGDWLEIWSQLTVPAGQMDGYLEMIGQDLRNPLGMNTGLQRDRGPGNTINGRTIFIPLQFWFCRHVGLALPLIALQYSEVKINLTLSSFTDMVVNHRVNGPRATLDTGILSDTYLWADYIYLDTDERRRFAQISHEYLIEQLQYKSETVSGTATTTEIELNDFHHPIKELVWTCRHTAAISGGVNQWCNYTTMPAIPHISDTDNIILDTDGDPLSSLGAVSALDNITNNVEPTNLLALTSHSHVRPIGSKNPIASGCLMINGNKRFSVRNGDYFNWLQCRDHHSNIPLSPGINVYTFADRPEQHQPSGACNFTRIINSKLWLTFNSGRNLSNGTSLSFQDSNRQIQVFAVNYNVLRVMSGMAAVSYPE